VLIARVEARLRSSNKEKRWFRFADLKLDTVSRIGYCRDQDLVLTQKEFSLLLQLARQGGRILPKEQLYEAVWGRPLATDSTALYTAISRLNAKLGEAQSEATISYLRGQGYMLETV
jgi:DNA-binding response OmpR family regulator